MSPTERPAGALTGKTVAGYRILELVGAGAMGEVYRAHHLRLRRTVAIKVLKESAFAGLRARQRFIREAQAASRIMHPYVTTVLDVVESEEGTLLVQEFVEGRRLDSVLRERRLAPEEAVQYGMEICEALAAVHAEGFVHRDVKPANVMITAAGHVKLLDLGIVRRLQPVAVRPTPDEEGTTVDPTLTTDGSQPGTLPYMSPEQARGDAPDERSDLFALGVVLWEMLTGEHPFARPSERETLAAILTDPPGRGVPPRRLVEFPALRVVLDKLLAKNADDRYRTARTAMDALRAAFPTVTSPRIAGATPERHAPRRRLIAGAALALAAAAAALLGPLLLRPSRPGPAPARPAVAVLPFADRTGDARGDLRGGMLAALLTADLGRVASIRAVSQERMLELTAGLAPDAPIGARLDRVRRETGARWLVSGSLWQEGAAYYANVELYGEAGREVLASFRVGAGAIIGLVDQIAPRLLRVLAPGEAPAGGEGARPSSDNAASAFFEGRQALREMRLTRAVERLEAAVREDPAFADGWLLLARALYESGYGERARQAAERALRQLEQARPGKSDPRLLRARAVAAMVTQRRKEEIGAREELADAFPDEPKYHTELAEALLASGDVDAALAEAERAVALDPRDPRALLARARALARRGRQAAADEDLQRVERIFERLSSPAGGAIVQLVRGHLARGRDDLEAAQEAYVAAGEQFRAAGLPARAAHADLEAGLMSLRLGDLEDAHRRIAAAIEPARRFGAFRSIVHSRASLGAYCFAEGRFDEAERELRAALETSASLENPELRVDPLLNLAGLLVFVGRTAEARATAAEARAAAKAAGNRAAEMRALSLLADADRQEGRLEDSIAEQREVLRLGSAVPGADQTLGYSLSALSDALRATGRLAEALAQIDRALALESRLELSTDAAASHLQRALLLAELGDPAAAAQEIRLAEPSASRQMPAWLAVVRAQVSWLAGDVERAEVELARAEADAGEPELVADMKLLEARLALERSAPEEAEAACRAVLDLRGSPAVARNLARTLAARARQAAGDAESAREQARRALEEAERFGSPLLIAEAAVALLESGPVSDAEAVRESGVRALERLFAGAPEGAESRLATRRDVGRLIARLRFDPGAKPGKE